jgi:polar amino acid transport system substrate-binding protein
MPAVFPKPITNIVGGMLCDRQPDKPRGRLRVGILRACLSLLLLSFSQAPCAQSLRVVCAEIAPFCFVENGVSRGYVYEIGQEILKRLELQSPIEIQPLARSLQSVQKNSRVISLWVGRIPERENTVRWVTPIVIDAFHIFTLKGKAEADTIAKARQLGAIASTIAGANLIAAQHASLLRIEATSSEESNLKKLLAGRVDGWIAGRSTAEYAFARLGLQRSEFNRGVKLADYTAYIAASADIDERTVSEWTRVLETMHSDGHTRRIMQKYGVGEP